MEKTVNAKNNTLQALLIRIFEFLLLFVIFLDVNTVYTEAFLNNKSPVTSFTHTYAKIISLVCIIVLIALHLWVDKSNIEVVKQYKFTGAFLLLFATIFYAVNVAFTIDSEGYIGSYFLIMTLLPLLFKIYRNKGKSYELLYVLERIVIFAAVTSLLIWLGSSVLNRLGEAQEIRVLWGGDYYDSNYINLCFRRYWTGDLTKNLSVFTEPPMFGLFLNIALYTEFFLKKNSNIYIVIILLCALVSCRATLALIIAIIAVGLKFVELFMSKKWFKFVFIAFSLVCILAVAMLVISKRNLEASSFGTHIDDYFATLKCFVHSNWLVGCGYENLEPIIVYESSFRADNPGMSNSIGPVLAQGGLLLSLYFLFPLVITIGSFFKKNKKLAFWGLGMLLLYTTIVFNNRVLIFLILSMGYSLLNIQINKTKPYMQISFDYPSDNLSDDNDNRKWYEKCKVKDGFIVPKEMTVAGYIILVIISVYTLINCSNKPVTSIICASFAILVTLAVLCIWIVRLKAYKSNNSGNSDKSNIGNKLYLISYITGLALWGIFIVVGHMYASIDGFLRENNLLLQDAHWSFVICVVIFYILVAVMMTCVDMIVQKLRGYNE